MEFYVNFIVETTIGVEACFTIQSKILPPLERSRKHDFWTIKNEDYHCSIFLMPNSASNSNREGMYFLRKSYAQWFDNLGKLE